MSTLTSQPDGSAQTDTIIYKNAALVNNNYITTDPLQIDSDASNGNKSLIKFDLSSLVGASITDATLTLTVSYSGGSANVVVSRILSGNSSMSPATATWNKQDGTNNWAGSAGCSTSGTDYSSTPMGSIAVSSTGAKNITLDTTEFTAMVANNYGMIVVCDASFYNIYSADNGTAGNRPKLVVNYTASSGAKSQIVIIG